MLSATLSGAAMYVYLTGWAHVVIDMFHVAPQYFGFTFLINGIGLIVVSQTTARLAASSPGAALFCSGPSSAQALAAAMALLFGWTGWGGLLGLLPWPFLYCSLIGRGQPHRPPAWP